MDDSHGATREQAVAPVLSVLEFTYLLIQGVLASMTASGRRALEVHCGRMVAVPEPGGRGESVGTEGTAGVANMSNKANSQGRDCRPRSGRGQACFAPRNDTSARGRRFVKQSQSPSVAAWNEEAKDVKQSQFLWAGGLLLGIGDWGLGIRGGGGAERQTNPISRDAHDWGLVPGVRGMTNEANMRRFLRFSQ